MGILLWMLAIGIPVYFIARLGNRFFYVAAAIISLVVAFATGSIAFIGFDIFAILVALTLGASHATRTNPAPRADPAPHPNSLTLAERRTEEVFKTNEQNFKQAYVQFSLAAASGDKDAVAKRNLAESKLSPAALREAQEMASEQWHQSEMRQIERNKV